MDDHNRLASSTWIISPGWDLACLAAAPLLIVPFVTVLVTFCITPEQLAIAVIAFASAGHHLPGFLRAYGERELFHRFRWRFLLAPPLLFALVSIAVVQELHSLELILLLWATWHILMQTYGFMRIYDLKQGRHDARSASLDWAACLAVFSVGMVFSDIRMYGVLEVVTLIGLPPLDSSWLRVARWVTGIAASLIFLTYLAELVWYWLHRESVSWMKLVLVLSTTLLYWGTGRLAVNMLVGVAMFEIFHAVQYDAIAWFYGKRLATRQGREFGPLGFLYGDRWFSAALYLGMIAVYGLLYFGLRSSGGLGLSRIVIAIYTTSALLHFYYDGFIWKVREKPTQLNLQIEGPSKSAEVSGWMHAAKWTALACVAMCLILWEAKGAERLAEDDSQQVALLATWTPRVPELQSRISRAALQRGDNQLAVSAAEQALLLRPRSHAAHANMGAAWLHSKQYAKACDELRQAIRLDCRIWQYHYDLALAEQASDRWSLSEQCFRDADRLQPQNAGIQQAWGEMHAGGGRYEQAKPHFQQAVELDPHSPTSRSTLVSTLSQLGEHEQAIQAARTGTELAPDSAPAQLCLGRSLIAAGRFDDAAAIFVMAVRLQPGSSETHYQLGLSRVQLQKYTLAAESLDEALKLEPDHALAHFQRGNVSYLTGDANRAILYYQRCTELSPAFPDAFNNLGAVLFDRGHTRSAKAAYLRTLELRAENPQAHYNVGLLMLQEGDADQAREHFRVAAKSGLEPPPAIKKSLGL